MTIFTFFFAVLLQILNLPALHQNKNTRVGPFPWKWSVLQNPDRERTNQSTGICLRLALPYNKRGIAYVLRLVLVLNIFRSNIRESVFEVLIYVGQLDLFCDYPAQ